MSAPKNMRGLLAAQLKRDFSVASAVSIGTIVGYQTLIKGPRKRKYEEFYK